MVLRDFTTKTCANIPDIFGGLKRCVIPRTSSRFKIDLNPCVLYLCGIQCLFRFAGWGPQSQSRFFPMRHYYKFEFHPWLWIRPFTGGLSLPVWCHKGGQTHWVRAKKWGIWQHGKLLCGTFGLNLKYIKLLHLVNFDICNIFLHLM